VGGELSHANAVTELSEVPAAFAGRDRSIDLAPYRSAAPMSYGAGEASGLPFSNT
jgi:hypothetical protein